MYFRLMAAMFDSPATSSSKVAHASPTVLLYPENIRILALGISLLACKQDETYVIAYVLPLMAAMFDLPVTPMSGGVFELIIPLCYWTAKMRGSRWNSVAIVSTS